MAKPAIKRLNADCIDSKPINVDDWREVFRDFENADGNQFWEAYHCQGCNEPVVLHMGGGDEAHKDLDSDSECDGHVSYSEGPMMNYWYPLHDREIDPQVAARAIADLPLCVVQVSGVYGLALTGGGMDLSWEICEAFTRLWQLPPAHFAGKLPRMAGRGDSTRDRYIISACRASLRVRARWTANDIRSLRLNFPKGAK